MPNPSTVAMEECEKSEPDQWRDFRDEIRELAYKLHPCPGDHEFIVAALQLLLRRIDRIERRLDVLEASHG